jgi:hypothetical protein
VGDSLPSPVAGAPERARNGVSGSWSESTDAGMNSQRLDSGGSAVVKKAFSLLAQTSFRDATQQEKHLKG